MTSCTQNSSIDLEIFHGSSRVDRLTYNMPHIWHFLNTPVVKTYTNINTNFHSVQTNQNFQADMYNIPHDSLGEVK